MFNIDKIKSLSKEKGISLTYLTNKLGVAKCYFNDLRRLNRDIPDDRLSIIADILGTTTAYLRDETDDPAPPNAAPVTPAGSVNAKYTELISLLDKMDDDTLSRFLELARISSADLDRALAILRLTMNDG